MIEETQKTSSAKEMLIGKSLSIERIRRLVYKVAPLDTTILLLGETGTGKEIIARMIHENSPARLNKFIPIHLAGIPETLLESALFGHEKGAFTGAYKIHKGYFETANNGTLFLDEIGEISFTTQVKLLRVLQDKKFYRVGETDPLETNARIIAATNQDLKGLVNNKKFREDLYYRLNVVSILIPPLREHPEDIPLLINFYLRYFSKKHNLLGVYFKPQTIKMLQSYSWPGNVRELVNVVERMVVLAESDWIGPEQVPDDLLERSATNYINTDQFLPFAEAKNLFETEYINDILKRTSGNVSQASRLSQIPRQNLHAKIKKYGIKTKIAKSDEIISFIENIN